MNTVAHRLLMLLPVCLAVLIASCDGSSESQDPAHQQDGHASAAEEFERGPHRGRLLRKEDFALEVTIFETGVPPQFRLYAYRDDKPLPGAEVRATIELGRLGGVTDTFEFAPEGDYLVGNGTVVEPHSFDVTVSASHAGHEYRWEYASYEGRTTIPAAIAEAAGMTTAKAGPAVIRDDLSLMGRIAINGDRYAQVRARFPGPVLSVNANAGDSVRAGQTLATVENSETLRTYTVTSPIDGTVLARHTSGGDVAGGEALFEIADLSTLWLDLHAFGDEAGRIAAGLPVHVATAGGQSVSTTIQRVLPLASSASQSVVARALLPNPDGKWRPGMAVEATVTAATREVPVAVDLHALQRFRDFTVVFAKVGDTYEVRMLELGARDQDRVEVLGGIAAGTEYAVEQSFLIKADIEKSGASHDH